MVFRTGQILQNVGDDTFHLQRCFQYRPACGSWNDREGCPEKSPDFALIFAGIGLCFCPVIMILVPHLPLAYRGVTFIVLMTVLNAPQCAVALCTVQILLNAAPEKNRSLLIGLFTMMTTLTNSVLPLLGVRLYTALGADLTALYRFNLIDLGVRILSTLGLVWRYQKAKKDGFLTKISD